MNDITDQEVLEVFEIQRLVDQENLRLYSSELRHTVFFENKENIETFIEFNKQMLLYYWHNICPEHEKIDVFHVFDGIESSALTADNMQKCIDTVVSCNSKFIKLFMDEFKPGYLNELEDAIAHYMFYYLNSYGGTDDESGYGSETMYPFVFGVVH